MSRPSPQSPFSRSPQKHSPRLFPPVVAAALVAGLFALAFAVPATADNDSLSPLYQEWRQGPVQLLMLPEEEKAWEALSSDAEAETFIRLFWDRRDPTPDTELNERQRDFEQWVAYAAEHFGEEETAGPMTDRGKVFVLLGPPHKMQKPGSLGATSGGDLGVGGSPIGTGGSIPSGAGPVGRGSTTERMGVSSEERWIYEDENKPDFIEQRRLTVRFLSKPGTDEVRLLEGAQVLNYMALARKRAVVRPELTAADLALAEAGAEAGAGEAGAGEVMAFRGEIPSGPDALANLRAALGEGGGAADGGGAAVHLDASAFQATDGRWILPYQVSTAEPTSPTARVVGEVVPTDAAGAQPVVAFRLEQPWEEQKGQHLVKDTLVVPTGDYELRVGLEGEDGTVRWTATESVEIPAPGEDFWVSELILSDWIYPMDRAQQMLEPYAWQGIVVVPRGDRIFRQGELMWFYLHACNPVLADTGKPSLRLTARVEGPTRMRDRVQVQPTRAGDRCWVLASGLQLTPDRFPAGDYEMNLLVRDSEAGESRTTKESFTVVAP